MKRYAATLFALTMAASANAAAAGTIVGAKVERTAPDALTIAWQDDDPIDLFVTTDPAGDITKAQLLSNDDRDGHFDLPSAGVQRRYFLLRDERTGRTTTVAERLLPLERGSNFRDIGGYPAAGGRHVRWGMIYRSGATPLLSDADVQQVLALRLANLVDLRSSEERVLAPTRLDGIAYTAVGYPIGAVMKPSAGSGELKNGGAIYRNFPTLLAPQLRIVFADLLANKGPIAYNCSAGQDRTGFVTAIILTALGTPRDSIIADYHLSTQYRRPVNELPRINLAAHPGDPVAALLARYQDDPRAAVPQSLKEADGTPFLAAAFDEIEKRWGSVDIYLAQEIGVGQTEVAALRRIYLQ